MKKFGKGWCLFAAAEISGGLWDCLAQKSGTVDS